MDSKKLLEFANNPLAFRQSLLIDVDGETRLFKPEPWQSAYFECMDSAWMTVAGYSRAPKSLRAFIEAGRGCGKTTTIAADCLYALIFSKQPIQIVVASGDKEQAGLISQAIKKLLSLNPVWAEIINCDKWRADNGKTGSELLILSSDAATSYGLTPNAVIIDELTNWRSQELWNSLFSAAAKRKSCVMTIITNAGCKEGGDAWQWKLRESIRQDPSWYFATVDRPASWITPERLAEQQLHLPDLCFRRLWLNEWTEGSGDALTENDIRDCTYDNLKPMTGDEQDYLYFGGLDLSVRRDHAAFVVIGKHIGRVETIRTPAPMRPTLARAMFDLGYCSDAPEPEPIYINHAPTHKYRLALCQSWKPTHGDIDLEAIERAVLDAHQKFGMVRTDFDPFQAMYLSQRLVRQGVPMMECPFVGQNLNAMASTLLEEMKSRNVELYRDDDLIRDLHRLRIIEKSYGVKLEAPRDATGHADRATGLCLALLAAKRTPFAVPRTISRELVCWP